MRTLSRAVLCAVLTFAACDHTPPPTPPAIDAETVRQLFEHMEELVAALRARSAAPDHQDLVAALPAVAAPERTPADAPQTALSERLEALEREVAQLRSAATGYAVTATRTIPPPPKSTASVELAVDRLANNTTREQARRSFFMLSMQQVVDQLGVPDSTSFLQEGRVSWIYESNRKTLELTFRDGGVMHIGSWTAK